MKSGPLWFLVVGWLPTAPAATILDPLDTPGVAAIDYQQEAARYPQVGKVNGGGLAGSGVIIGDRWVLTAGHISVGKAGGTFEVGGASYLITSTQTHPAFSFGTLESDIGLLFLASAVIGVPPAVMVDLADSASLIGQEATWVGHGLGGTGRTGEQVPPDFRAFTNVIDVVGTVPAPPYTPPSTAFVSDFDRPGGGSNAPLSDGEPTRLEGGLAAGDSGGGVFWTPGGAPYLIGLNSYQAAFTSIPSGAYGTINGATNLDLFLPWIADRTGIRAVPEPGAWLLVVGAAFGWLVRARRRRLA